MAPEFVYGEEYDSKVDIWSLGVITYELLTGRVPFKNNGDIEELSEKIIGVKFDQPI